MRGDGPVTRHSHGGIWHEHPSGHVRHDHEGMVPGGGSPFRGEAMLGIGVLIAVVGGIAMLWKSGNHSACASVLVRAGAPGPCSEADLAWTAGIVGLVLGVGLVIAGAIMRSRA
jgi:hypothetical protein